MQDRQLYAEIWEIQTPWFVDRVELKLSHGEVHVHLGHHEVEQWPCPERGKACRQYDHQTERQWRHLDTCQYQTVLHAKPPRAERDQHGVRVVKLPWAEPSSRLTALFERLAIDWLTAASQKAVGERLGVDEKAFRKGQKYFTLVNDLERSRVLYVAEDRTQTSLDGFWPTLSPEQAARLKR